MNIKRLFVYRVLVYALGLLFLAFSVAFAINSNLGISPVNSLPYVLSLITAWPLSLCVICVFSTYILLQVVMLRRRFRWYNVFQLAFSTLFGYFTTFAKWVVGDFCLPTYWGQLGMLLISVALIGIGISLYVSTSLIPMPMEGLSLAISQATPLKFPNAKLLLDCVSVGAAALLSFAALGRVEGIKEGTLICALLAGKAVALAGKYVNPLVRRICFPAQA